MKALLINVVDKTITTINIEHTNEIYAHIGNGCTTFCAPVDFPNGDTLFSDDDGLLHDSVHGCFALTGWQYPLVGNAVILGSTDDGDTTDCKSTPEEFMGEIIWGNKVVAEQYREIALSQPMKIITWESSAE